MLEVASPTWRQQFGGIKVEQTRRLKELERENALMKRLMVDFSFDKTILTAAARGNT